MGGERHTIASLDVLRGFAISSVVVGQFAPTTPQIELSLAVGLSIAGVVLFFFLFGFLMDLTFARDNRLGRYLIRRTFRILPMYWISIVLIFRSEGAWSAKDALCKTTFAAQSVKKATFSTYPTMSAFSRIAIAEVEISERGGRHSIASSEHRDRAIEFTRDLGFDFIGRAGVLAYHFD